MLNRKISSGSGAPDQTIGVNGVELQMHTGTSKAAVIIGYCNNYLGP